jgi:hypothetical protein
MKKHQENHLQDNLKQRRMKMKKIIILFILAMLLISCVAVNPNKCLDYQGDKKCIRFYDGQEYVWE